jgi:hypothetical protein
MEGGSPYAALGATAGVGAFAVRSGKGGTLTMQAFPEGTPLDEPIDLFEVTGGAIPRDGIVADAEFLYFVRRGVTTVQVIKRAHGL